MWGYVARSNLRVKNCLTTRNPNPDVPSMINNVSLLAIFLIHSNSFAWWWEIASEWQHVWRWRNRRYTNVATEWTLPLIIDHSEVEYEKLARDIFTEERDSITNLLRKYRRDHLFKWHPCWFPTVSFIVFIRYNNWQSASVSRWSISSLPRRDIQAYSTLVNVSHATGFFWRDHWT